LPFSSLIFLFLFLPLILVLYHSVPVKIKPFVLFIASMLFLAWAKLSYLPIILISVLVNMLLGKMISGYRNRKLLILAIVLNLLVLFTYKYTFFIFVNLNGLLKTFGISTLEIPKYVLPLGISFYTFRIISYHIDLYRKRVVLAAGYLRMFNYIAFFPQLGAGPIVRYNEFSYKSGPLKQRTVYFVNGLRRFVYGLAKKVLIANTLGLVADAVFALPVDELNLALSWLGMISYALQLYYDFSAYTDMAIGITMCLGYRAPENFNYPYLARSVKDFWTRWHMSLTNWFRDYLFLPLAFSFSRKMPGYKTLGMRSDLLIYIISITITWFLVGFWHGSDWNFVIWGIWFAIFLGLEQAGLRKILKKLPRIFQHFYALIIILIAWVFFRSANVKQGEAILQGLIGMNGIEAGSFAYYKYLSPVFLTVLVIAIGGASGWLNWLRIVIWKTIIRSRIPAMKNGFRIIGMVGMIAVFLLSIAEILRTGYSPFIYFKF
jgi:alginate O-acetyltransferase complex protein AlgI